jgi:hypothetical protein
MKKFFVGLFLGAALGAGGTGVYLFKSKRVRTFAKRELEYKIQELADRLIFGDEEALRPDTDGYGYAPPRRRPFRYGPPPRVPYERYRP